jgi:type VI secretion system protein ImpA
MNRPAGLRFRLAAPAGRPHTSNNPHDPHPGFVMALLDIQALLAPISPDDPGGPDPRQVRDKDPTRDPTGLDKLRAEAREEGSQLSPDDPRRLKYWRDVAKLAGDLFATRSKSLSWAIWIVDAAARAGGFTGATEGFQFLTRLTNDGWNWMWPKADPKQLDSADPEERETLQKELQADAVAARAGRYQSLDDPAGGLLFPNVFREWIIASADGVEVSVFNTRGTEGRPPKVSHEDLQAVARKIGPERAKEIIAEIDTALAELDSLRVAVEAKFFEADAADQATSFREVRTALEECRQAADGMLMAVEGDAPEPQEAVAPSEDGASAPAGGGKDKVTRAGLYKQIAQIADHLTRLEPHSPVPFLLRRVVELQDLPFPELVRQFTHNGEAVLAFLERSLTASSNTGE